MSVINFIKFLAGTVEKLNDQSWPIYSTANTTFFVHVSVRDSSGRPVFWERVTRSSKNAQLLTEDDLVDICMASKQINKFGDLDLQVSGIAFFQNKLV